MLAPFIYQGAALELPSTWDRGNGVMTVWQGSPWWQGGEHCHLMCDDSHVREGKS